MEYVYYVSPDGCDDAPGTSRHCPFASLQGAFNALKRIDKSSGSATIYVEAGLYFEKAGLTVEREVFGNPDFRIRVVPQNGRVRLTGGRRLKHIGRKGDALVYDAGGLDIKEIYLNGRRRVATDYVWGDSGKYFLDAEVALLTYPRFLRIQVARHDQILPFAGAEREYRRFEEMARALTHDDSWYLFDPFEGRHEFCPDDECLRWLIDHC